MEKRIGVVATIISNRESVGKFNNILSDFNDSILARQGLPLKDRNVNVISLIVEGTTDQIGALTGRLGRLDGVQVKSILTKNPEGDHGSNRQLY